MIELHVAIDFRRDIKGFWHYRRICGVHCLSLRLPFTRIGLGKRRFRR